MKEENEQLKRTLDWMEDYRAIQERFFVILKPDNLGRSPLECSTSLEDNESEPEPVWLSLGMCPLKSRLRVQVCVHGHYSKIRKMRLQERPPSKAQKMAGDGNSNDHSQQERVK